MQKEKLMFPFDQRGQNVNSQINVGGDMHDPVRAAAYDLLAACEEMVAYIYKRAEEWDRVHGKGNFFENINDAESTLVDVMRTAIAKAKGDQP
jgi:hypothetical protein